MNTAVQFSSHRRPTERRDPEARVGKTCALVVDVGRLGIGRVVVCVEIMWSPLGRRTAMGRFVVALVFVVGRLDVEASMKCPVAPVSALMRVLLCWADGIAERDKYECSAELICFTLIRYFSRFTMCPPFQFVVVVPVVLGVVWRGPQRSLLPPMRLLRVAASLCPSFLRWHLLL